MSKATDELRDYLEGFGPHYNNEDPLLDTLMKERNQAMATQRKPLDPAGAEDALRSACERYWTPPAALVSKIQRSSGISLDYVDHASVTRMLIDVDPLWTWEPMGTNHDGSPIIDCDDNGNPRALWIHMTVYGKTIPAVGTIERPGAKNYGDSLKELIGDAIRNGALRFGVCGSLWARGKWDNPAPAGDSTDASPSSVARALSGLDTEQKAKLRTILKAPAKATISNITTLLVDAGYDADKIELGAWIEEQSS